MRFSRRFYRFAAGCSFASAATTLALILLPSLYGSAEGLEARLQLVDSTAYAVRAWVYLLHPLVALAAALGVATVLARKAAGAAAVGLCGFFVWAVTEAGQQSLTLIAYHGWAEAYAAADGAARRVLETQIATYDAIWDSMFFLLLVGFLVGNVAFGIVLSGRRGFDGLLGVLYLAVGGFTVFNIVSGIGGPGLPSWMGSVVYPILQPLARVLIGVWLLRVVVDQSLAVELPNRDG